MKNKGVLFLNHTVMGGAEKSSLEQLSLFPKNSMDVYLPSAKSNEESIEIDFEIDSVDKIRFFNFPHSFSKMSRGGGNNYLMALLSYVFRMLSLLKLPIHQYDFIWLNGLKVFVLLCPILCITRYRGKVYFHLRDYLNKNMFISFCIYIARITGVKLEFIANSESVKKHFFDEFKVESKKIHVCYNICKMKPSGSTRKNKSVIGLCSMLTPWKGIHTMVLFSKLYEKELKNIGIEKVQIYGGSIYNTVGEHSRYLSEIKLLCGKLSNSMIEFRGRKPSEEIYRNIDILIHSSIKPEPFGRIILEGFGAKIPVLSAGLGGSAEILEGLDECCFDTYDYAGLFLKIENLLKDNELYNKVISKQSIRYDEINALAETKLSEIFSLN